MLKLRDATPVPQPLARADFTTLRLRLIKIAARITETASRGRIALAAAHPEAELSQVWRAACTQQAHDERGQCPRNRPIPSTLAPSKTSQNAITRRNGESRPRRRMPLMP